MRGPCALARLPERADVVAETSRAGRAGADESAGLAPRIVPGERLDTGWDRKKCHEVPWCSSMLPDFPPALGSNGQDGTILLLAILEFLHPLLFKAGQETKENTQM